MPHVTLFNGQKDYYEVDDFTDPWKQDNVEIVIFQPGIMRHTEFVYHVVPLLSGKVRFIRRDLRGHGKSTGDEPDYIYNLDTLIDEMADFVDKVARRPVHWIGESSAAMLSIAFAAKHRDKLRSLILIGAPVTLKGNFAKMVSQGYSSFGEALRRMGIKKWQAALPVSNLGVNQKFKNTNNMGSRFSGPEYQQWYEEMLDRHRLEGVARYCDYVTTEVDVSDKLEKIEVPTLIIASRNSAASPVSLNEEMKERIKNSKLVIVESIGHMVYIDKPDETCRAILDWVDELAK